MSLKLRENLQKQKSCSHFKNQDGLNNQRSQRSNILDFSVSHKAVSLPNFNNKPSIFVQKCQPSGGFTLYIDSIPIISIC